MPGIYFECLIPEEILSELFSFMTHDEGDWLYIHLVNKRWFGAYTKNVDYVSHINRYFIHYVKSGNVEMVKEFLDNIRLDPTINLNRALLFANKYGKTSIVDVLLNDKRVNPPHYQEGIAKLIEYGKIDGEVAGRKYLIRLLTQPMRAPVGVYFGNFSLQCTRARESRTKRKRTNEDEEESNEKKAK